MADDKLNEGSEEEKKSSNDLSDDDFGLPDLEFDELQELDLSSEDDEDEEPIIEEPTPASESPFGGGVEEIDMSVLDDIDVLGGSDDDLSILDEGIEEVEDVLDSAQLISDRLGDDDEEEPSTDGDFDGGSTMNYDDLMGDVDSSDSGSDSLFESDSPVSDEAEEDPLLSSDDLFASIDSPDDLAALGMADEEDDSTDSLFAADIGSSSDDDMDSLFDSDSIAMSATPEEEVQDEFKAYEEDKKLPDNYKAYTYNESSGGFTKIIVIGVVVIAVIAAGMLWLSGDPESPKKQVAQTEKAKPKPAPKKEVAKPVEEVQESATQEEEQSSPVQEEKAKPALAVSNSAPAGEIEQVTAKTGLSYVIIGSFIDQDLAMDYAQELSEEGRGVKVIHPYGKSKRYRVSVADFSTYGDAASQLGSYQDEYGQQVWALKY
ncbi:hypothetical protein BFP72_07005 [Reichenbachiella sp. 5M10]|uniref:SPOR domain-containing protein n=1 Tax=Reichenbachiella sp. 5M10 TaxID=1889772 RepID=UPI000C14AA72|nr:SPOR domain-containing protein [Reichenbachiella sp. 5M10]PIB35163.1 hypothetical protein BFP72_07005 [Reichenbachiella sp. 5M10]